METEKQSLTEQKIVEISEAVYNKMMSKDKNSYDPEVQLPPGKIENSIPTKKHYRLYNRDSNTQKRCKNRPSVLEKYVQNKDYEAAEQLIRDKYYYATITEVSQNANNICDEKTARKIIKSMLELVGYKEIEKIPRVLMDEVVNCVKKWMPNTKTLYKCNNGKLSPLDMNEEEMVYTYDVYLLAKKLTLIECNSKEEYDKNVAKISENKRLTAVYAAIREIKTAQ